MHWSCWWLLDDGLVINPFSTCTQPSILVIVIKTKSTQKSVVSGGGKQEQVRLEKRPKAILKHYVSGWREMQDSDDGRIKILSNVGIYNLYTRFSQYLLRALHKNTYDLLYFFLGNVVCRCQNDMVPLGALQVSASHHSHNDKAIFQCSRLHKHRKRLTF